MNYALQIIFMLVAFIFMSLVLHKQWTNLRNTRTEYEKSRKVLLVLVFLVFLGNFSHLEPGHLIHAFLLALVGFTWWYWYKIVDEELADREKLEAILKRIAADQLESVKSHQEAQREAIEELHPKTQKKINELTAVKDIEKTAERNKK